MPEGLKQQIVTAVRFLDAGDVAGLLDALASPEELASLKASGNFDRIVADLHQRVPELRASFVRMAPLTAVMDSDAEGRPRASFPQLDDDNMHIDFILIDGTWRVR